MSVPSQLILVVCRSARQPLTPGAVYGYRCQVCKAPLQVLPFGLKRLKEEGAIAIALCNTCGSDMAARVSAIPGKEVVTDPSPQAAAQMERQMPAAEILIQKFGDQAYWKAVDIAKDLHAIGDKHAGSFEELAFALMERDFHKYPRKEQP